MIKNKAPIIRWFLLLGSLALFSVLMRPQPALAQCGSSASSCKSCHEVQAVDPVNNDGTSWHQAHAFGDFCEFCHAGNVQATEQEAAHVGLEAPLSNVQVSCGTCHAADLAERADVYAVALGVTVGEGGGSNAAATDSTTSAPTTTTQPIANAAATEGCAEIDMNDPNLINYSQNYNEIVLGKRPVNWGNTILIGLIGLTVVGGGTFVVTREKLINISLGDTRKVNETYPADVVQMLPHLTRLKTKTRRSLYRVLQNPQKADKICDLIDAINGEDNHEE